MNTLQKTAMMYRAVNTFPYFDFTRSYEELPMSTTYELKLWAEIFGIKKGSHGESTGKMLYKRLQKYHEKYILDI